MTSLAVIRIYQRGGVCCLGWEVGYELQDF